MALIESQVNDSSELNQIQFKSNYFPVIGVCICSLVPAASLDPVRFEQLQVTRGRGGLQVMTPHFISLMRH